MRKGSDVLGKPVVAFDTGEQINKIQDLIFDQEQNLLLGFVVDEGGWFSDAEVLPLLNVQAIGPDIVIVPARTAIQKATQHPTMKRILNRNNVLKGTKVATTDGQDLGKLVDLYFDEESGRVEGYEVSGGLFADAYTGRSYVPAPKTIKIGDEVAFVPPETAELMAEQVGGLRGAAQAAGAKAKEAGERAKEASAAVGEKVKAAARDATATGAIEEARGRRVNRPVYGEAGILVAAQGQIVTDETIARARIYDKEEELLEAVNLSPEEAAKARAQGTAASARTAIETTASQAKSEVQDVLQRTRARLGEYRDRSARRLEEERIKGAVGRTANRVILDPQDNVILNVGEIITWKAIRDARTAGVLDILLGSVHKADPAIAPDELRAGEPGRAALEEHPKVPEKTSTEGRQ